MSYSELSIVSIARIEGMVRRMTVGRTVGVGSAPAAVRATNASLERRIVMVVVVVIDIDIVAVVHSVEAARLRARHHEGIAGGIDDRVVREHGGVRAHRRGRNHVRGVWGMNGMCVCGPVRVEKHLIRRRRGHHAHRLGVDPHRAAVRHQRAAVARRLRGRVHVEAAVRVCVCVRRMRVRVRREHRRRVHGRRNEVHVGRTLRRRSFFFHVVIIAWSQFSQ